MIIIKGAIAVLLTFISLYIKGQNEINYKFSFGPDNVPGYIRVDPLRTYSPETKYGFDFGTYPNTVDRGGNNTVRSGFCTSHEPFFFSVALPEGNYDIRIITGDMRDSTFTTVRTESRRLLFERIVTLPGRFRVLEATVNLRVPEIAGTNDRVIKKPRELYKLDWDEKLTFEFTDSRPCICSLEITRSDKAVTIFLAGNSTVVDQDDDPWASWGQMFPRFLRKGVAVANHAESGLSLGTFVSSNRLRKILSLARPGDYLFIEFGHNDQKEKGPDDGAFKSFSERMRLFVNEFRKAGGIPVIVSPANRRSFGNDGKIINSLGEYPEAAKLVAKEMNVPFIDLNNMTKILYESLGNEESKKLFVIYPANSFPWEPNALNDNTHFNSYGAYELAKCIIRGISGNNLGIEKFLVKGYIQFDPSKPDDYPSFSLPVSPHSPVIIDPINP
jgi:lysophospholipase L1-like esterase